MQQNPNSCSQAKGQCTVGQATSQKSSDGNVVNVPYWLRFRGAFTLQLSCHPMCSAKSVSQSSYMTFWRVCHWFWWCIWVVRISLLSMSVVLLKLIPYSDTCIPECRLPFSRQGRGTGGGLAVCLWTTCMNSLWNKTASTVGVESYVEWRKSHR